MIVPLATTELVSIVSLCDELRVSFPSLVL